MGQAEEKIQADRRLRELIQEEIAKTKRPMQPAFSPEGLSISIPLGDYLTLPIQLPYSTIDDLKVKADEYRKQTGQPIGPGLVLVPGNGKVPN